MVEEDVAFHHRLGHLLESVEREEFWPTFASFLRERISFDSWVVLVFREADAPILVHEGDADRFEDELFRTYLKTFFREDPFFRFSMRTSSLGVHRLDEVAYPCFRDSDYYLSYFRHNVVGDEIQLLAPFARGPDERAILSLSLGSRQRFSSTDYGRLSIMAPWVRPLLSRATLHAIGDLRVPDGAAGRDNLERQLRAFDQPRLSEREVQTALLILSGQSTKGIAAHMGISPETAKVHRRNLYEKLSVRSQADLFLRYLAEPYQDADARNARGQ